MDHPDRELITAVRRALAESADSAAAPDMRRYMKSELPFRGVKKPARVTLARTVFATHPLPDIATFTATVRTLWHEAEFREERYLALDLTGFRTYRRWQSPDLLPLYRELIVSGAWWDFVDEMAARRVGPILRAAPDRVTPVMRDWSVAEDRWLRRTSVICQLRAEERTDTALLAHCAEATIADPDFFLRKAIGWALRDYAKVDPDWVRTFVDTHPGLSPLSVREAMKHLR